MTLDVALIVLGAAAFSLGLLADALKRVWLTLPLAALVLGVLLGPEVLGVLRLEEATDERVVMEEGARIALAFTLTAAGLQFTRGDLRAVRRPTTLLLTVVMVGMWTITALGAWLLLDIPFWVAALLGAILTPTDPVVAGTLVTGAIAEKELPRPLRRTLQLESGANDGLALAFVLLPAIVLAEPTGEGGRFAADAVRQIGLALVVGLGIGAAAGWLANRARALEQLEPPSFFDAALGLALLVLGLTHFLGGTGVLAAFLAGLAFSLALDEDEARELEQTQSGVERLFTVGIFVAFGSLLPWAEWASLGTAGLAFALWVLVLRRLPVTLLALRASDVPVRGRRFLGWYGPLGVAALYYTLFVERYGPEPYGTLFGAATLAIVASVVVHSVTATPGVRAYGRREREAGS